MFPNVSEGLTISKIIGGISKSLKLANQIIPIYEQAKPMVKGAKNAFYKLKNIAPTNNKPININNANKKTATSSNSLINNPSFFK